MTAAAIMAIGALICASIAGLTAAIVVEFNTLAFDCEVGTAPRMCNRVINWILV